MATVFKMSSLLLSPSPKPKLIYHSLRNINSFLLSGSTARAISSSSSSIRIAKNKQKAKAALAKEKRRTRSDKELDKDAIIELYNSSQSQLHIPVMLAEVLDVFSNSSLTSFVDCTLGAAGHSTAVIRGHPELKYLVGMDVDPVARDMAQTRLNSVLNGSESNVKVFTVLRNFRHIKSVLIKTGEEHLGAAAVDGILMDLGMSSMQVDDPQRGFSVLGDGPLDMRMDPQASLKAEDILNSWPDSEVGRILREYGEESNWRTLQKKIVQARLHGGLHSTGDLLDLIRRVTPAMKGGRQGWIKTATRVFQALRIAVNDELKTLEESLYSCFDCLAPGGRLAVISFHSLEDRIVKQTFLDIIKGNEDIGEGESCNIDLRKTSNEIKEKEAWIRHVIHGSNGTILTKRPITPSEEEEKLNRRSRSAKLRVIQKLLR
ncbi:S-adenosyl-L-methionine-dependent methyltransferase, MraW, recognition domain superfamily [Sesbania bispinosa]|nr:S-adenosyl-L-methionine-dependent methyltransferase, MraW, recognition domain superfamily [Sesbania bispinosa]